MDTKLFVTIRNRSASTKTCVESLVRTVSSKADIYLFDNMSQEELNSLLPYYSMILTKNLVSTVIFNRPSSLKDVFWHKSYNLSQMLALCGAMPSSERRYIICMDNDTMSVSGEWIDHCKRLIEDSEVRRNKISILSAWDSVPRYETIKTIPSSYGQQLDVRTRVGSPCLFSRYETWKKIGDIPCNTENAVPDDSYIWNKLRAFDEYIGVLKTRQVTDVPRSSQQSNYSARLKYAPIYPTERKLKQ